MNITEHPQSEELFLWQTGELSAPESKAIQFHVEDCLVCQRQLRDAEIMMGRVAKVDSEAERRERYVYTQRRRNRAVEILKSSTFKGTTASIVIAALLLVSFTEWTPQARAESLLNKAIEEQAEHDRPMQFLKVKSGAFTCNVALGMDHPQLLSVGATNFCQIVSSHLLASGRQWSNLLSAKSFQQWRHELPHKQDAIHKSDGLVEVSTSTDEGSLRKASLRLQPFDYHPVSAHFEFADTDPLTFDVNEDHAAEEVASKAKALADAHQSQNTAQAIAAAPMIDPLDETEAHLRLALHKAQLDRNILLAVERRRNSILVWGDVPTAPERQNIMDAAQNLPHVQVSVLTEAEQQQENKPVPWTSYQGDAPPLANDQLTVLFPDEGTARQQFQNELDTLTRNLLGETKSRDALVALRGHLTGTPYEQSLSGAAKELGDSIRRDTLALSAHLAPLTKTPAGSLKTLTYRQALQLYTLVHEMTYAGRHQDNLQLAQAIRKTRALLSGR